MSAGFFIMGLLRSGVYGGTLQFFTVKGTGMCDNSLGGSKTTMLNFIVIVGALTILAAMLKSLSTIKLLTRWHRLDNNKRFEQNCELVFPVDEEDEFEKDRR